MDTEFQLEMHISVTRQEIETAAGKRQQPQYKKLLTLNKVLTVCTIASMGKILTAMNFNPLVRVSHFQN